MALIEHGRDWTIYFRDGASEPPAVHPGHDRQDYEGWQRMEVVRADACQGAVEDVADLVNALADAASRFRRDGDVFGAEQAEAILKRFGGQ